MSIDRREFLARTGLGLAAGSALVLPRARVAHAETPAPPSSLAAWPAVRAEFLLSRDTIHLSLMLLTSHPRAVREAIERHRRALDENPVDHLEQNFPIMDKQVRTAAARYLGGSPDDVALTDSTTMGLAVVY